MVVTPTNHTSRAFFGELEYETEHTGSSEDEQSNIDNSQFMESSTHTNSVLADASNHPGRRGANASVLQSVLEETPTGIDDPGTIQAVESDPIFAELRNQDLPPPLPIEQLDASTTTRASTMGPGFSTMPSRTIHTSNVDAIAYKQMEEESDRFEAWAIHVVLGVFCGLILVSVLLTFFVIENYGFVAMVAVVLILSFMVFLTWFIDRTILSQHAKFKPMRSKIIRVVEVAKKAVVEEFNLFKRDWNEHYLLTNEPSMEDDGVITNANEQQQQDAELNYGGRPAKKKRSVLFRAIKPAFRFGRRIFRGKAKSNKKTESTSSTTSSRRYHPPAPANGVI